MDEGKLEGMNRKYASIYDKFAAFYDLSQKIIYTVFYGGEKRKRMQFLRKLEVRDGETVLETSCGTGGNFHYLPKGAFYHGMDISAGMLAICLKNLNRWGRKAFLVRAEAENLPYKNGSFDVVFQYGGFNFFNDRKKALNEMIRVARPGARLMIADETEQVASASKGLPCIGNIYTNKGYGSIYAPVDMIPEEMENVKCDILFDGTIYCITFRKPLE
jgi:ubiquinone/menaquinone biosynthesis C-methylase UbiE